MEWPAGVYRLARSPFFRRGFVFGKCLLVFLLALGVENNQIRHTLMLVEERVQLPKYFDGTIEHPFVHRMLTPQLSRLLLELTPPSVADRIETLMRPAQDWLLRPGLTDLERPLAYYWVFVVQLLSFVGYAWLVERITRRCAPHSRLAHFAAPLALVALFPIIEGHYGHLYDPTSLLTMAALVDAITAHRHGWYLIVFVLACCTKETAVFASVGYACYFLDRLPPAKFVRMIVYQAGIFSAVYVGALVLYAENPGGRMFFALPEQLGWLSQRTITEAVCFLVLMLVYFARFPDKPPALQRLTAIPAVNALFFLAMANPGEWRNFYESLPVLIPLAILNLEAAIGPGPRPSHDGPETPLSPSGN
ncbi:MAG: hypothetical protein J0M17_04275 [Planctomycetes bacterium]|nr:hypothetical protein [Planctomycetota bacterium]